MTDEPGRPPEERLPATRPSSTPVPTDRFYRAAVRPSERPDAGAGRADRAPVGERALGRLPRGRDRGPVRDRLLLLRGRAARRPLAAAARGRARRHPGHLGRARLQHLPGELRAVPRRRTAQGGKGPMLNSQDKLFAHLSPEYIHNMLLVGGRYACGNPNSIMPVWANTGSPPGPLNYKQIEDVIAFIRADEGRHVPRHGPRPVRAGDRPRDGRGGDLQRAGSIPNYVPAPGSTPYPACWLDSFATAAPSGGASASPGASAAPSASPAASASPEASASAEPSGSPAASGSPEASGSPAASGSPGASAPRGRGPERERVQHRLRGRGAHRPRRRAVPDRVREQGRRASRTTSTSRTPGGTSVFKGDIFPGPRRWTTTSGRCPRAATRSCATSTRT